MDSSKTGKSIYGRHFADSITITQWLFTALLIKELAGYPNIHFDGTKEKDYDLLIVDHSEISEGYRYKND